mgnify:FL=1
MIFSIFVENYNHLKTMKKSESTSRKETPEEELKRLREENKSLKSELKKSGKQHEQTKGKLKKAKDDLKQTKAELKKKDVTTATLSKEQKKLLSTLFPDIDIRFW